MSIFQIFAILFALFMLYIVSVHAKKKTFSWNETLAWGSLWVLFIILAIFPQLLQGISDTLNFSRVFDLLVVGAFMVISILTFSNYINNKKLSKKLEDAVRQGALESKKK